MGRHVQELPPEVSFTHVLAGEPFTTSSDLGAIVVYRWSSKIVYLDRRGNVRGVRDGVEPIAFPDVRGYEVDGRAGRTVVRIDPQATAASRSVCAFAGMVYVLFRGVSHTASSSVLDVYDEHAMRYVGSYRIPAAVEGIAVLTNGDVATIENGFVPLVKVWRGLDIGRGP
jgi:hypothetical protein